MRRCYLTMSIFSFMVLLTALCPACSATGRSAPATVDGFLTAWDRQDGPALTPYVNRPAPGFAATLRSLTSDLHATSVTRTAGAPRLHGNRGQATVVSTYILPGIGPWKETTTLGLLRHSGTWYVDWSPGAVAPGLVPGETLDLSYTWAPRAGIVGAAAAPLTSAQPEVVVGIEGSRVKDPTALTQLLVASGATATEVSSALAAAVAHPTFFEPVFEITEDRYNALGGQTGALHQAPGTVFQHTSTRAAITPGLASHLVGTVGPVTAQELALLGSPYDASSVVGQNGLESYYQKQLAGTPGGQITIRSGDGREVSILATFTPTPGRSVVTGIEPVVQQAAESALSSLPGTAAIVAIRVSTGEVIASVSDPAGAAFDSALDGEFPPGSTFKVLTSTALLGQGLSPAAAASCPPSVTVDGETFHNAEGDQPVSSISAAFVESCNTAFVQLATAHLQAASFTSVASEFGLGRPLAMGYPAFSGQVPAPKDAAALAATSIGQAGVVVSPLALAAVAADVARGSVVPPKLVAGSGDDTDAPTPLPAQIVSDLHGMMAAVVTSGTAANTGLPPGTYAKTGTAQYGHGNPLPTDAWLIGWRGDIAFAMVDQGSNGNGGPVDGPVIARFLAALPAGTG